MEKKINIRFLLIAAIAILATAACAMFLFFGTLKNQIFDDLRANLHAICLIDPEELPAGTAEILERDGIRLTLIAKSGEVLYDSITDEKQLDNHGERPEIQEAAEKGEGRSVRRSETISKHTFYYAMRLSDGRILRLARESSSIYHLLIQMGVLILLVGGVIFLICALFARRLTRRLIVPIEKMADHLVLMDENEVYEEMRPFVATIKQQHMDLLNHAQMRQEFTANVTHELKTPLTAVSGYAELIAGGMAFGEDAVYFAGEIQRSAERLQMLINDIMKLSELDDDDISLELEPLELSELGKNCLSMLKMQAQKQEVRLEFCGEPVQMNGNKMLIEELLFNLCSNAVRYNKKGGSVTLTVKREQDHPVIIVADTGIGIPADQQERVFERFYRVDKSRSKATGGTGLGLAIVKHIAVRHNAQIFLTSKVGEGTEIKVVF